MAERVDLTELEYHFRTPLSDGLKVSNIQRVVEVGIGSPEFSVDLSAIRHLANLEISGERLFGSEDILGIDPGLPDEDYLLRYVSKELLERFRRQSVGITGLAASVRAGDEQPFDLVLCKGVLSSGLLYLGTGDYKGVRSKARRLLTSLTGVLNKNNPDSLMIISDVFPDTALPVSGRDFENRGLRVVRGRMPVGRGNIWVNNLIKEDPGAAKETFYSIAIAQPK